MSSNVVASNPILKVRGMKLKAMTLVAGLLPSGKFKNGIFRRLGHDVHPDADIGPCLLLGVETLRMRRQSRIGTLTAIRGMVTVDLGASARIGQLNWISSAPDLRLVPSSGTLVVGEHSAITNRHYIDCSGGVRIGSHTTVAGVRSTLITHGIDWRISEQSVAAINIGSYCIVSSNVNLTPGTTVPDRSVVGMGVTIDKNLGAESGLILADRGALVKRDLRGAYFSRNIGVVDPPSRSR